MNSESPASPVPAGQVDTANLSDAPSKITRKIRSDKNGNLLFAAYKDVIMYDGRSFAKIPQPAGFESVDAFDALQDKNGNIWIGSTHFGVFRYDGKTFRHFTTDDGLAHDRTMDLMEDSTGKIWIATMGGVSRYDGNSFRNFTASDGLPHNDVNAIMEDSNGKIWFGTREAACFYDPVSATFSTIADTTAEPFVNVRSIAEDGNGVIYLAGEKGILRHTDHSSVLVSDIKTNGIHVDRANNIWLTSGKDLLYFENETLQYGNPSIKIFTAKGMLFGVATDTEGNVWVGTLNGAFCYTGKSVIVYQDKDL
ncbi:MAG: two-component regulator propeller domain-containing protein [Cyclobacteriaceae bacterium]